MICKGVVTMNREVAEEVFDPARPAQYKLHRHDLQPATADVAEWGQVFPEPVLANAAIDRMFDRAHIPNLHRTKLQAKRKDQNQGD